jgi:hypothetical protein
MNSLTATTPASSVAFNPRRASASGSVSGTSSSPTRTRKVNKKCASVPDITELPLPSPRRTQTVRSNSTNFSDSEELTNDRVTTNSSRLPKRARREASSRRVADPKWSTNPTAVVTASTLNGDLLLVGDPVIFDDSNERCRLVDPLDNNNGTNYPLQDKNPPGENLLNNPLVENSYGIPPGIIPPTFGTNFGAGSATAGRQPHGVSTEDRAAAQLQKQVIYEVRASAEAAYWSNPSDSKQANELVRYLHTIPHMQSSAVWRARTSQRTKDIIRGMLQLFTSSLFEDIKDDEFVKILQESGFLDGVGAPDVGNHSARLCAASTSFTPTSKLTWNEVLEWLDKIRTILFQCHLLNVHTPEEREAYTTAINALARDDNTKNTIKVFLRDKLKWAAPTTFNAFVSDVNRIWRELTTIKYAAETFGMVLPDPATAADAHVSSSHKQAVSTKKPLVKSEKGAAHQGKLIKSICNGRVTTETRTDRL